MKINQIKEPGQYDITVLIQSIEEKISKTQTPFLVIEFADSTGKLSAKLFNSSKEEFEDLGLAVGDIVEATVRAQIFNGGLSFIVDYVVKSKNQQIEDFIPGPPEKDIEQKVIDMIESIKDENLKLFVSRIFKKHEKEFTYYGAAKSVHHNYYKGLLFHSLSVARNAKAIAENYPFVNKDIVIAGALLHDIGKIKEMDSTEFGACQYTVDGNLFGHLFLGAQIIQEEAKLSYLSDEVVKNLLHIIVSHHDNMEWGAIKCPITAEAKIVAMADYIDSRLDMTRQELNKTETGTLSANMVDGGLVYKPIL